MNSTTADAVEEAGENTAAVTEHSKLSDKDKVQWLTDRLAHSVTDLSRTKPDQTSSSTDDKGRWVERLKNRSFDVLFIFRCEICVRNTKKISSLPALDLDS